MTSLFFATRSPIPSQHLLAGASSSAAVEIGVNPKMAVRSRQPGPDRFPREARAERWGPFSLSRIFRSTPGGGRTQIGWGANCNGHANASDAHHVGCKKQLAYGSLDDEGCVLQLKRWLLAGLDVKNEGEARRAHVDMNARTLTAPTAEEVAAWFP